MNSAIYECRVMHHRLSPKEHQFRYEIFLLALDLDELDLLAKHLPFFIIAFIKVTFANKLILLHADLRHIHGQTSYPKKF